MFRLGFLIIIIGSFLSTHAQNNSIVAFVIDGTTKKPIENAKIEFVDTNLHEITSREGFVNFRNVSFGPHLLNVSHENYDDLLENIYVEPGIDTFYFELNDTRLIQIEEVVVSSSRTERKLKDVAIPIQIIDLKKIEKSNQTNFRDFLEKELVGVEFTNNGGVSNISMLGFGGKYVLFLIDGERIAGETFDNIDYNRIDINNIERIEIVKGASSSLYGSNAIGGVINIITKKASKAFQLSLSAQYGSINDQNYNLTIGSNLKKINFTISSFFKFRSPYLLKDIEPLVQRYSNGEILELPLTETFVAGYTDFGFNPKIILQWSPKVKSEFSSGYYFQERNTGGLEGYKIRDQFENYRVSHKTFIDFDKHKHLVISTSFDDYEKLKYYKKIEQKERVYENVIGKAGVIFDHTFHKHLNVIGAEFFVDDLLSNLFNSNVSYSRKNAKNYSVFTQQDWIINKKITLVTGARLDYHSQFKFFPTFRMSGMYKINKFVTFRSGYSGGFRAPTLKELYTDWFHPYGGGFQIIGNEKMKTEKSHNFNFSSEIMVRNFSLFLLGQYSKILDKVNAIWLSSDTIQYLNSGTSNILSNELSASYKFEFNLKLNASYCFIFESPKNSSTVRPHTFTFNAEYTPLFIKKFIPTLSLSGKFYSPITIFNSLDLDVDDASTEIDIDNYGYSINYESYAIWRLQASINFPFKFNLSGGINNLFNYKTKFNSFYSSISPGRTYFVSLRWNFEYSKKEDRL